MDKPTNFGFSVLELRNLLMYEMYYNILRPYFGEEKFQLHYTDCNIMVLRVVTQDIIQDLENLRYLFDFSNLNRELYLLVEKIKRLLELLILKPLRTFG